MNYLKYSLVLIVTMSLLKMAQGVSKCYECSGGSCNNKEATCSNDANTYCETVVSSLAGFSSYSKKCSKDCSAGSTTSGRVTVVTYCCQGELCNSANHGETFKYFSKAVMILCSVMSLSLLGVK